MACPAVLASGVGSLPGDDIAEAVRTVLGELPDLPFLPELPNRGPGAEMIGRTAALLAEAPVDLQPSGWRLVSRPGRDLRRARSLLAQDLDALEEAVQGGAPPVLKLQCAGPWTLAAGLRLNRGERALADPGAVDDVAASLAEGLAGHLADVRRRVPGAEVLVQLDEPGLPAVLAGRIPTSSGFGRLRVPDDARARQVLERVLEHVPGAVVHCCADDAPLELLVRAGAGGLAVPVDGLGDATHEALGTAVERGVRLLLGAVPSLPPAGPPEQLVEQGFAAVTRLWHRLGLEPDRLAGSVVVTPTCGLAGTPPEQVRAVLSACVEIARRLGEAPA